MTDPTPPSNDALFRFVIVSEAVARIAGGERRVDVVRAMASRVHTAFGGSLREVSERSLQRWLAAYAQHGIEGLEAKSRAGSPRVLSDQLIEFLVAEQSGSDAASIPELIRRATERAIIRPGERVHRSTVYRTCKRLGIPTRRGRKAKYRDARRFAYAHRMEMVLCDGKHFRAGERRAKRVALFFLDDATRYPLHTVVGTSESEELFLRGLYECIVKHGYMGAAYLDRGPGFISTATAAVFGQLGIPLIHGEAGYKEGRGKVERFNRTAKADVLRSLDGRPDVDPACGALELRLRHYAEQRYAHNPHESLGSETPWQRFHGDPRPLRFPDDSAALRRKFEICFERLVSKDNIVQVDGLAYEMPRGYAEEKVLLRRRLLDGGICAMHAGRLIELQPVDTAANARAQRARGQSDDEPPRSMPRKSAADLAFERDFKPVVGDDGGALHPIRDDSPRDD